MHPMIDLLLFCSVVVPGTVFTVHVYYNLNKGVVFVGFSAKRPGKWAPLITPNITVYPSLLDYCTL